MSFGVVNTVVSNGSVTTGVRTTSTSTASSYYRRRSRSPSPVTSYRRRSRSPQRDCHCTSTNDHTYLYSSSEDLENYKLVPVLKYLNTNINFEEFQTMSEWKYHAPWRMVYVTGPSLIYKARKALRDKRPIMNDKQFADVLTKKFDGFNPETMIDIEKPSEAATIHKINMDGISFIYQYITTSTSTSTASSYYRRRSRSPSPVTSYRRRSRSPQRDCHCTSTNDHTYLYSSSEDLENYKLVPVLKYLNTNINFEEFQTMSEWKYHAPWRMVYVTGPSLIYKARKALRDKRPIMNDKQFADVLTKKFDGFNPETMIDIEKPSEAATIHKINMDGISFIYQYITRSNNHNNIYSGRSKNDKIIDGNCTKCGLQEVDNDIYSGRSKNDKIIHDNCTNCDLQQSLGWLALNN